MSSRLRVSLIFPAFIGVLACGPQLRVPTVSPVLVESERERQREQIVRTYFERAEQVARVSTLLRTNGAELCGDNVEPVLGVFWMDRNVLSEEYWPVAERIFGVGEDLRVLALIPKLPAEAGGVKPGDVVLKINGADIESRFKLYNRRHKVVEAREMIRKPGAKTVTLTVRRAGEVIDIAIEPVPGCGFPAGVVISDAVNAFADGSQTMITTGMLRFLKDDDELAVVLGHEMAHNTLDHSSRTRGAMTVGMMLGLVLDAAALAGGVNTQGVFSQWGGRAGQLMFSKDYEAESDYLGLYFAVRSGFDISKAADLWRRMAADHPGSIKANFLSTHPSTPERAVAIEASLREIREKINAEAPLVPAMREGVSLTSTGKGKGASESQQRKERE